MKQRFVIVTANSTPIQENLITQFFKNGNFSYWHWFPELWLVIDNTATWNPGNLRDKINELTPDLHNIVFRVDDKTAWAIRGMQSTFPWLHNDWSKD
ncbi:MAG TPA: hypothetical protein VL863_07865 [bacterium]|jgi:hypothetical protein|nr:hypothetical protein [bacterium]